MDHSNLTIQDCINGILERMTELNYRKSTIQQYAARFNRFKKYCDSIPETHYSEKLSLIYLRDELKIELTDLIDDELYSKEQSIHLRVLRLLSCFNEDKTFVPRFSRYHTALENHKFWYPLYASFIGEVKSRDVTVSTVRRKEIAIRKMIEFFIQSGVHSEKQITKNIMYQFVTKLIAGAPKSLSHEIGNIKEFFRYAYLESLIEFNPNELIPKVTQPHQATLPTSWEVEDIKKILESIDRDNPVGKRNYSIILLACRLGLRGVDITNLKLSNINWETNEIRLHQKKTGNQLVLPLLKDVGWALIDYLKNGRPESQSDFVFLRLIPPYTHFEGTTSLNRIFRKAVHQSGVPIPKAKTYGLHSLRHTLGRVLLEGEVPLQVIAGVLGHHSVQSTQTYLKINIEGLLQCAIDPNEVFKND